MIQTTNGLQAGPRRNIPAQVRLFPSVLEVLFLWSGCWVLLSSARSRWTGLGAAAPGVPGCCCRGARRSADSAVRGHSSQDRSTRGRLELWVKKYTLTSEPKPTESYRNIAFLESGFSERIRAVLLSLGFVPLSLFAVPMKPSLCTFPACS